MSNISSSSNISNMSNLSSFSNNSTNGLACPTASESDRQILFLLRYYPLFKILYYWYSWCISSMMTRLKQGVGSRLSFAVSFWKASSKFFSPSLVFLAMLPLSSCSPGKTGKWVKYLNARNNFQGLRCGALSTNCWQLLQVLICSICSPCSLKG